MDKTTEGKARHYAREWYYKRTRMNNRCAGCYSHVENAFKAGCDQTMQDLMERAKTWFTQQHIGMFNSFKQYIEQQ